MKETGVTPVRVVLLAAVIGATLIVSGVALLAGVAWALIVAGCLILAAIPASLLDVGDIP